MNYLAKHILVVMALKVEGGQALENAGASVLYTGVGKVNAAYQLTKKLSDSNPKLVINFGTAGSKLFKKGELVAANRFIQRDMDVSAIGFQPFTTPFENTPPILDFEKTFTELPHATLGTGDSFSIDHDANEGELLDMEAYALAKICYLEKINFACVKYVSDGANENASADWQDSVSDAADQFVQLFKSMIDN